MRKRALLRNRLRSRGRFVLTAINRMVRYYAFTQYREKWTEWNARTISLQQAQILVAAGEAEAITRKKDGVVQIVGYRALKPTTWERPSPATLTFRTMVAVGKEAAGDRLTHRDRLEIVKFRVWPLIGDTRAVCVRPLISEAERRFAESLLAGRAA